MMVELDVEPVKNKVEDMFDGLAELNRWYNAPPLLIFSRVDKSFLKEHRDGLNLNPVERKLRVDDLEWVEEGLKIIEERKRKDTSHLVYTSTT